EPRVNVISVERSPRHGLVFGRSQLSSRSQTDSPREAVHRLRLALNFTIRAINAYGIFRSSGNRRLPFSFAYGATAFSSAALPFTGGENALHCGEAGNGATRRPTLRAGLAAPSGLPAAQ